MCSFNDEEILLRIKAHRVHVTLITVYAKWQNQIVEAEKNREIQEIVKKRIK